MNLDELFNCNMDLDELLGPSVKCCDNFNHRESRILYIEEILHKAGYETEKQNDGLMWKTDEDESVFIPVDEDGRIQDFKYSGHKDVEIQINSTDDKLKDHIDYNYRVLEAANIKSSVVKSAFHDFISFPSTNAAEESLNICFGKDGNYIDIITDSELEEEENQEYLCLHDEVEWMEREKEENWD